MSKNSENKDKKKDSDSDNTVRDVNGQAVQSRENNGIVNLGRGTVSGCAVGDGATVINNG